MGIREAARALKMPETTAQSWYKKESQNAERKKSIGRPMERSLILRKEYEQFLNSSSMIIRI